VSFKAITVGELIFQTDDIDTGWDGNYKGTLQNNDVYVWKVLIQTWRDEEIYREGSFNLMR